MQMNSIVNDKNIDDTYIEKCKNYQECLNKLKELFSTSGVEIEYNDKLEEAYLHTESRDIPMKKLNGCHREAYSIEVDNKLIGFYFDFTGAMFGFGVDMEVIVKEGKNFQSYAFKQSYFENGSPWFYYDEYMNGTSRGFSSNGHIIYFNESNVPTRSVLSTINRWGDDLKIGRFTSINAQKFAFGGMHRLIDYDKDGSSIYTYIPTVESENIKRNKSEVRSMIVDTIGPTQIYEVKRRYHYTGDESFGIFFPYFKSSDKDLVSFAKLQVFNADDPKILDYCIDVLKRPENQLFYYDIMEYLNKQPVKKYMSKYFTHLTKGIEYYQNLNQADVNTKNVEFAKALKLMQNN